MKPAYDENRITIYQGDVRTVLGELADQSIHCCITSPPYWGLRDYGVEQQIGLESTPDEYIATLTSIFHEVKRVLRDDGTLWLNMGDGYASAWPAPNTRRNLIDNPMSGGQRGPQRPSKLFGDLKEKDLIGMPWLLAFALRADGWYLRSDIIWAKPNGMPESVEDRPTRSHEYIFLLSKSERYHFDYKAIEEPASMASEKRWNQDIENQNGSLRANGGRKTNGPMKAVGKPGKQRGHSRRHNGFNDRWDAMKVSEQCSGTRRKRDVWTVSPQPFPEAHFATFPEELIRPCILAGCPKDGAVLDPFMGSGTTALVARRNGCRAIGIELNPAYIEIAKRRLAQSVLAF